MTRPLAIPERLGHLPEQTEFVYDASIDIDTSSIHNVIVGVDEQLHTLHQYGLALQTYGNQTPDYSQAITTLHQVLDDTLQKLAAKRGSIPWEQYYALLNREVFIEELAYAPLVLGARNIPEEQLQQFTNGTYGLNVHLLADALDHYDTMNTFAANRKNLRGIINELTSVALLNRDQAPGHLALPAHHMADAYHKTDTIYYHRTNGKPYATNVQVKSHPQSKKTPEQQTPTHGILITADDMHNLDNFATSRAIVAELYQEPQYTNGAGRGYLNRVHVHFMGQIHQKIHTNNARYEPHKTTTLGISAQ